MITVTSVEAQNRFGQLLDMAQREPITITRHGRAAAFMVSPQDMEELTNVRAKRSIALVWRRASPRIADFRLLATLLREAHSAIDQGKTSRAE